MPVVAFAGKMLGLCGGKKAVHMGNVFGPTEEPEGVACWEMDLLTFAAHRVQASTLRSGVKGRSETKVGASETGDVENSACSR